MISVCMTSYNGEKYITGQLDTILPQLGEEDELIVSDDGSSDGTPEILVRYAEKYPILRVVRGPGKGVIKNFEYAIGLARGDLIVLSDQDDLWESNKISRLCETFAAHGDRCLLVLHDAEITDASGFGTGKTLFEFRSSKPGLLHCLWKNPYVGCCMAFRRELVPEILPFPDGIEMHDWWIALNAECGSRTVLIPDRLIRYRRHDGNVSGMYHYPLKKMLHNRLYFVRTLTARRSELWKNSKKS